MRISTKREQNELRYRIPEASLRLLAYAKRRNRRDKKIPKWRVMQLGNFVAFLNETAFQLDRARQEGQTATLAWLGRNFLELSVWMEFCCTSEENARRFNRDAARDLFGMMKAAKHSTPPEFNQSFDHFLKVLETAVGPSYKLTDEYKRVADAAAEIGRGQEFVAFNKFFSKMAHPTAFVIKSAKRLPFSHKAFHTGIFFFGINYARKSMVTLIDFVLTNFPNPDKKKNIPQQLALNFVGSTVGTKSLVPKS